MRRFIPLLLPLALPLVLVACSPSPSPPSPQASVAGSSAAPAATIAKVTPAPAATTGKGVLARYHWRLASATDAGGQRIGALFANAGKPLQLDFQDKQLSVSNTCNRMHGPYRIADGKLTVGPLAQTLMACNTTGLAALDKTVDQLLQGSLSVTLPDDANAPRLTLGDSKGNTLVFAGQPTAQTRYGSAGRTVFLEVAPQTVPCAHPVGSATQCLKVRTRHFDDQGLKVGTPGSWHPLEQPIEGYTHTAGVRNVLRVKAFKRTHAPAGAASTAYVLDMVVASESPGASGTH